MAKKLDKAVKNAVAIDTDKPFNKPIVDRDFSTLTGEKVLSGYDGDSALSYPLRAIGLGTWNFYLGIRANLSPVIKPQKVQTEINKNFMSLLNLDSERPEVKLDEMNVEDDKKISDEIKLSSALAGIKATSILAKDITNNFHDPEDKVTTKAIEWELKGGNIGGGLQTAKERIISQGVQWCNTRISEDTIIAQNRVIGKILVDSTDENGEVIKDKNGKVIQVWGLTDKAKANIKKREHMISSQVAEETKYKLAEVQSRDEEICEDDAIDLVINACKDNNIDMTAILEQAVMRKVKTWNDKQNFQIDNEVLMYGQYLINGNKA